MTWSSAGFFFSFCFFSKFIIHNTDKNSSSFFPFSFACLASQSWTRVLSGDEGGRGRWVFSPLVAARKKKVKEGGWGVLEGGVH